MELTNYTNYFEVEFENVTPPPTPDSGGGNVDLTGYATEEYVDQSVQNLLSQVEIFYINLTPTGENTVVSDKSFSEVVQAFDSGKNIKCRIERYVLPLCLINNAQAIFGGATSNLTVFVSLNNDNTVHFEITELATKAEIANLPSSEDVDKIVEARITQYDTEAMALLGEDGDGE